MIVAHYIFLVKVWQKVLVYDDKRQLRLHTTACTLLRTATLRFNPLSKTTMAKAQSSEVTAMLLEPGLSPVAIASSH